MGNREGGGSRHGQHAGEIGTERVGLVPADSNDRPCTTRDSDWDLDGCRQYLLMIANEVIGTEIQGKIGASDLVQDTFVEAQRHARASGGEGSRAAAGAADPGVPGGEPPAGYLATEKLRCTA